MAEILDSGTRREFETGAVRDIQEGKGRCDLLPIDIVRDLLVYDGVLDNIWAFMTRKNRYNLIFAFQDFCKAAQMDHQTAILEVAIHYEEGCKKYGERNWEKGIPLHCYMDSAVRHYLKYLRGDQDERHDRAFLWNIIGALWTLKYKPELDDLPPAEKLAVQEAEQKALGKLSAL